MEKLIRESPKKLSECPTCGSKEVEIAPGIKEWPPSSYKCLGEEIDCDCQEQSELFRHYLLARIPEEYMRLDGSDYYGDEDAWAEAETYLAKWDDNKAHGIGLGFYSLTQGTGKTFLATYVARQLIKRGESVFFKNFRSIVSLFELPFEERRAEEERVRNSTVLVLDEIVGSVTAAQHSLFAEKFEDLIRHRTNYNRVTMITTNLTPIEAKAEYPRTYSLLAAKEKHVRVAGKDIRKSGEIWDINTYLVENSERKGIS